LLINQSKRLYGSGFNAEEGSLLSTLN